MPDGPSDRKQSAERELRGIRTPRKPGQGTPSNPPKQADKKEQSK